VIRRLALVVTLAAALVACGSSNDSSTGANGTSEAGGVVGAITVSAAASLTDAFEKIGDEFEQANPGATVTFNFDSSTTLAQQALDGLQVDAFASADQANMTKLVDAGKVSGEPRTIAKNSLMIVVKPGNPLNIQTLADLNNAGIVALCGDTVPCGNLAGQALTKANVDLPEDKITRGQNARATVAAVAEGDADAGIVYVTDVQAEGTAVTAVPIAAEVNVVAVYPMAVLTDTINQPLADAFLAFVLGAQGQAALQQAGFAAP
jgi:molybdate transport system substrate-binding protein